MRGAGCRAQHRQAYRLLGLLPALLFALLAAAPNIGCTVASAASGGSNSHSRSLAGALDDAFDALPEDVAGLPQGLQAILRDTVTKLRANKPATAPNKQPLSQVSHGYCGLQGSPGQGSQPYRVILEGANTATAAQSDKPAFRVGGHWHDASGAGGAASHNHNFDDLAGFRAAQRRHADRRMLQDDTRIVIVVPVYWHIIINETTDSPVNGDIDDVMISWVTDFINVFSQQYYDVQLPFILDFKLMAVDRTFNDSWFYVDEATWPSQLDAMTRALHKGGAGALNIYSIYFPRDANDGDSFATGTASYPWDAAAAGHRDGVFIDTATIPRDFIFNGPTPDAPEPSYFYGVNILHYVGHWFGLLHTYESTDSTCSPQGALINDRAADTPTHIFNITALYECSALFDIGIFGQGTALEDMLVDFMLLATKDTCPSNGYLPSNVGSLLELFYPPWGVIAASYPNGIPVWAPFNNAMSTASDACVLIACILEGIVSGFGGYPSQSCFATSTQAVRMYHMFAAYRYNK